MTHYWGDSWPYWDELYNAERWFHKFYSKCTSKYPRTKEKYGTIRFEWTEMWIDNAEDVRIFKETIRRTVKKFPNVAGEVCLYAGDILEDEYFEGWCAGVCYQAHKTYWSSTERPNGV